MPARLLQTEGTVLDRVESGEGLRRFAVLGAEHGLLAVFQRPARRPAARRPSPDLFDRGRFHLEQSQPGSAWFLREYELLIRRERLARSYPALENASALARLLLRNLEHLPDPAAVTALAEQSLSAWDRGAPPILVLCKSIYVLARDEGLPVRQEWLEGLPAGPRALAETLLFQPLPEDARDDPGTAALRDSLRRWLQGHTDFR